MSETDEGGQHGHREERTLFCLSDVMHDMMLE